MSEALTLGHYLEDWAGDEVARCRIAETVEAIAGACREIAELVALGPLAGDLGAARGENVGGDAQKELDVVANDMLVDAVSDAPLAQIASEELEAPLATGRADAALCLAMDPLDGSSNIDVNVSIGTIFTLLPVCQHGDPFLQAGVNQLAAGYVIYGPQTALVLTLGSGTRTFTLDYRGAFRQSGADIRIPPATREFAINMSNYRHWDERIRHYVDDCLDGRGGPRDKDFNMRWIASLVAECHRILARGGVFLYPGDARRGYADGRLRLVYEANPIAWLIEQAGGGASTGDRRLLEVEPTDIHQRIPLIFGSSEEVHRVEAYYGAPHALGARSPLFSSRGLFRT